MDQISLGLISPKYITNVASAVRAAAVYGAKEVWYTGARIPAESTKENRLPRELRMRAYDCVSLRHTDRLFDQLTEGVTPVAIELLSGSQPLTSFVHPENAIYILGPEDGTIPAVARRHCHQFVHVPSPGGFCMNLAATINVVLYDRFAKLGHRVSR